MDNIVFIRAIDDDGTTTISQHYWLTFKSLFDAEFFELP